MKQFPRHHWVAATIVFFLFASGMPAFAQAPRGMSDLPDDVSALIRRRISCYDYSSKARADATFAAGIAPTMVALRCSDVQNDEATLRDRYNDKPQVLAALDGRWVKVFRRVPVVSMPDKLNPSE